jgi:hypothetical protein
MHRSIEVSPTVILIGDGRKARYIFEKFEKYDTHTLHWSSYIGDSYPAML